MARSKVYDAREFVDWFKRQIKHEMKCRDVDVESIGVFRGWVAIAFRCNGKRYLAKIREGRRFKISTYQFVFENGRLVGLERF